MQKKKVQNFSRILGRIAVFTVPSAIVLIILVLFGKISWWAASLYFFAILLVISIITLRSYHELEKFIDYLRDMANGIEKELPRFHKGLFSPNRLVNAFLRVKKDWANQIVSDSWILQNLALPLLLLNEKKEIVFMNQLAESYFSKSALNKVVTECFSDNKLSKAIETVFDKKRESEKLLLKYKRLTFRILIHRLPAKSKTGGVLILTFQDITAFQKLQQQQSDFFANASHELKTPLSIISGFTETLQSTAKTDPEAREEFLEIIANQTTKMNLIVQQLLDLSHLERTELVCEKVSVHSLLTKVLETMNATAYQLQKKCFLLPFPDKFFVNGNTFELQHLFQNLIDNALKYGTSDVTVSVQQVAAKKYPAEICIRVHNFGNPISAADKKLLFNRFYRAPLAKNQNPNGSGIGLSLVQKIACRHNANISLSSGTKKGTTFSVFLPLLS